MIAKREYIGFAARIEYIENRFTILNSNNPIEQEEITRLQAELSNILNEIRTANKPKLRLIKGGRYGL